MTRISMMLLAFVAGALTVAQTGMNAQLRSNLGNALLGAAVNFVVGAGTLLIALFVMRVPIPSTRELVSVPGWAWISGCLGATFVAILAWSARDLGATLVLSLVIAGQLVASVIFDHFGLLGFQQHTLSIGRFVGCLLILVALCLIKVS